MMIFKRFVGFLKEYRIVAISVAFIVGMAALNFVQSLVNDVILPVIRPLISSKVATWEEIILPIGQINIRIGSLLSSLLSLLLVVILLYVFVDRILHWKPKR